MEEVTLKKFKAFTGALFNSEKECRDYEILIRKIKVIMEPLNPIPDTINFINGEGYIQQDSFRIEQAKTDILSIGRKLYKAPNLSFGLIGRYADDSNNRELYSAWGRLANTDSQYREWGQMYYALNSDKGVQKRLNK